MNTSFKYQLKDLIREVLSEELRGDYTQGIENAPRSNAKHVEQGIAERGKVKNPQDRRLKQNRAK